MNFLRKNLNTVKIHFKEGGKWHRYYYVYEAFETFLFVPDTVNKERGVQVRDAVDLKRFMATVILAMTPCLIFGMWNVGHQNFLATGKPVNMLYEFWEGAFQVLPIVIFSYAVGMTVEFIFATIRRHPINEGYLVTGMLIPLVMPPDIPLWQLALAIIFAVIIAKEAFGGTGMNVLNIALTARAFLYFAYPASISGDVWVFFRAGEEAVAGYSGATPLAIAATAVSSGTNVVQSFSSFGEGWSANIFSFYNMFMGVIPGSIGETSVLMCLIGALILIFTGVGSWKIIISVFAGTYFTGLLVNVIGANEFMLMPVYYHFVVGGLAFGAVFMATDPVTATQTEMGKWIYGFFIGLLSVIIRIFNPAYPEGVMLAILLMNIFAPLIDYYVVKANKKRRLQRATL